MSAYTRTADDFVRAIELDPKNPEGYLGPAQVYQKMEQTQEALQITRKAIDINPRYPRSFRQLGRFYYDLGEYEKSVSELRKVVELTPKAPEAHVNLASPCAKLGKYKEAERELRIALHLRETLNAHVNLGAVLDYELRYAEAITHHRRAVAMTPNDYLSWINLGDDDRRTRQCSLRRRTSSRSAKSGRSASCLSPSLGVELHIDQHNRLGMKDGIAVLNGDCPGSEPKLMD